jgi:natural product biosynthesis luciferase-like monooxygenase protein
MDMRARGVDARRSANSGSSNGTSGEQHAVPDAAKLEPLSYGQRALWFLQRLAPTSTAYNFVFAARVVSATNAALLGASIQRLVDRHASLRTLYRTDRGTPVRYVLPRLEIEVESIACQETTVEAIQRRLEDEMYQPFDLERGPLFRAAVLTTPASERFVLLAAHHSIVDFESLAVLLEDLGEFHRAARLGAPPSPAPLAHDYSDYVQWQADMLGSREGERLWRYWREQLAPPLPVANFPTDRPRPPVQGFRGSTVTLALDDEITRALDRVAQESGATFSTVVLTAFQIALREWTGQGEVLVGCVTPGRKPEFARVVGYFVNPVVVCTRTEHTTFATLLAAMQASMDAAHVHQDLPFPLLVERLQVHRDASRSPLFQVLFAMYDLDERPTLPLLVGDKGVQVNIGDLVLESLPLSHRGAMLDLTLVALRTGGNLTAHLQFNLDLFDRETVCGLADRFKRVLDEVTHRREASSAHTAAPPVADRATADTFVGVRSTGMAFSLFFFASDDTDSDEQKYRLLFEATKFADRHGFAAVWTPERHFHAFGGIYPNPAVTGAALAAITSRLQIRAGSVVLPLHHPARVAEEWAMVDNISQGRVALSFASGWHANDFIFAPGNYAGRREIMAREIDIVRKLWRGESVTYSGGDGRPVDVRIWPRPIQAELPVWVTAFGSPETFRLAGQLGAGVLTHLLGQSINDLAAKIELFRESRQQHGYDPATGEVAVMLHTFVDDDSESVRERVRRPFINYLRTSVDLAKVGEQAGLAVDGDHYKPANLEAFLEATFERYYATNTLFGTPDQCAGLVQRLQEIGVTEIACLIDFGVDADEVLSSLHPLSRLKAQSSTASSAASVSEATASADRSVASVNDRVHARRRSMERFRRRGSETPVSRSSEEDA